MEGLTEGRTVHFVLDATQVTNEYENNDSIAAIKNIPICRPAVIVNAWGGKLEDGMINIQIFLDGRNDYAKALQLGLDMLGGMYQAWSSSVKYSETKEVGTWHWPERS